MQNETGQRDPARRLTHQGQNRAFAQNAALVQQIVALQRDVLSMQTFAHAANHDLRSPINAITGLLTLFEEKFGADLPEDAKPYLDHLRNAAGQLTRYADTLLNHAQSSNAPLNLQPVPLVPLVEDVIRDTHHTQQGAKARITIDGPNLLVTADATLLRILLGNLLSNALKNAADARPLSVSILFQDCADGATLTVRDTGRGFPRDKAAVIFAPFKRLNPEIRGHGVGLATCAEICRRHGWTISADSDGETGAAFTVSFPLAHTVTNP